MGSVSFHACSYIVYASSDSPGFQMLLLWVRLHGLGASSKEQQQDLSLFYPSIQAQTGCYLWRGWEGGKVLIKPCRTATWCWCIYIHLLTHCLALTAACTLQGLLAAGLDDRRRSLPTKLFDSIIFRITERNDWDTLHRPCSIWSQAQPWILPHCSSPGGTCTSGSQLSSRFFWINNFKIFKEKSIFSILCI